MLIIRALCGAIIAITLFSQSAFAVSYGYDELGRLITVTYDSGRVVDYDYDAAGNRTQHVVTITAEIPINDMIATLGVGNNLIDLSGWPVAEAPSGAPTIVGWNNNSTFYNEARWTRVIGPGESRTVTTMEGGQTEADENGGGSFTNNFTIDETKAYEFSIYFRKHDLAWQNLYLGLKKGGIVKRIDNNVVYTNPYFLAWSRTTQSTYLDPSKWYKIVAYVMPEGYPQEATSLWGGIYDVATGAKIASIVNYRWNEDRSSDSIFTRFFTYYSEAQQNTFTTYFYQPEVRVTDISYVPAVPALSISHVNATEGEDITYNVNLSMATTVDIKVDYAVTDGTASSNDYTAVSGTLTIPSGSTQGTITVPTTADVNIEDDETITLTLTNAVRATFSETTELATILTDDVPPVFSVGDISITEGGSLSFTVTKTGSTGLSHNVTYGTANGTASASDYTTKSGTLTFAAAETSKTVTVVTTQDSIFENNETLYLNLTNATNGAIIGDAQGLGTINNDDPGASFSVNDVSVSEGGSLSFTVTKTGSTVFSHNITYGTANGTATSASDYTVKSGTLTFTSGQTSKTVSVVTTGDSLYENNETLYLNLSGATNGAIIGDAQGLGTINNNDAAPGFAVNNVSVSEGSTLSFTVTKTGSTAYSHNVTYGTANNTAASGSDYTAKSGTLTFTSGQSSQIVSVVSTGDSIYENNETFYLNLTNATNGATITDAQGLGTINNNDTAPAFSINNASVSEGGTLSFSVTKSGSTGLSHNINYGTANGTAAAGSDYTAKSGTFTFTSGQASKTISVVTTQETTFEPDETLYVNLTNATSGATITDNQGLGTIVNDDVEPNDPPVANNDSVSTQVDQQVTIYVLNNDSDPDGDPLTVTSVGSSFCFVSVSTRVKCEFFSSGDKTVTYYISDGKGGTDSASIYINVTGGGGGGGPL